MKPYEKYKDSGIEWIGEIPEEWGLVSLSYISSIEKGKKPVNLYDDYKDGMIPYLSMEYLRGQTLDPDFVIGEDSSIVTVKESDLLILWDGSNAGEIVKARMGALSSTMGKIRLTNENLLLAFIQYYLKNAERYLQENTIGMGIPHVDGRVLKKIKIPTFPLSEQTQIARYLDHQCSIIDALIAKKQQLIELLKEKRQSLINEAVTRGLNPNATLKPSGIEWLGDIPEGWEVQSLKYLLKDSMQYGANVAAEFDNADWPRYIRITDFDDEGNLRPENFRSLSPEVAKDYLLSAGDILFARSGATVGKTFLFNDENSQACYAGYLIKASVNKEKLLPEFLFLFTKSGLYDNWRGSIFIQSTIQNISAEKYKNLQIPIPPIKEQEVIIEKLNANMFKINNTILNIQTQIEKLKEYRQSIISEAVTGKVDVRDWEPVKE